MPTGNSAIDAAVAGINVRRQRTEDNYIASRRAAVDPLTDAENNRLNSARVSLVDQYGAQAGDPTSTGQVQTNDVNEQTRDARIANTNLQPQVTQQGLDKGKFDLDAAGGLQAQQAMARFVGGGLVAQKKGLSFPDYVASISPEAKAAIHLTPDAEKHIVENVGNDPNKLRSLFEVVSNPDRVKQVLTGRNTKTGEAAFASVDQSGETNIIDEIKPDPSAFVKGQLPYANTAIPGIGLDKRTGQFIQAPNIQEIQAAGGDYKDTTTAAAATATDRVNQQKALPGIIGRARSGGEAIDRLLANDKGLDAITGGFDFTKVANGSLGGITQHLPSFAKAAPGTPAQSAASDLSFIKDQNFLAGIQTMKGSGPVSNIEGEKATRAIANLDQARTKEEVASALRDLRAALARLVEVSTLESQQGAKAAAAAAPGIQGAPVHPTAGAPPSPAQAGAGGPAPLSANALKYLQH